MSSHLTAFLTKPLLRQALWFLLVLALHSVVVVTLFWPVTPVADAIEPPSLKGVLVQHVTTQESTPEPVIDTPEPPQVKPEVPKPVKPKPIEPKPEPVKPIEKAAKPIPVSDTGTLVQSDAAEAEPVPTLSEPQQAAVSAEPTAAKPKPAAAPVKMPDAHAGHLQNPAPVYPMLSRKRKEQGTVILKLLVRLDGSVSDISIHQSSGFTRLDESAVQAVKRWHYTPAVQDGIAIDYWHFQPVVFSLN